MELGVKVKGLSHHTGRSSCPISKLAYIDRSSYTSSYTKQTYNWEGKGRTAEDLVCKGDVLPDELTQRGMTFDELLNEVECDNVCCRARTTVCRDWVFTLDNRLQVRNEDGTVNRELTRELIKDDVESFLKEEFADKGYAVHYAIHSPSPDKTESGSENFHIHVITLCNRYENGRWKSKSYKDENGSKCFYNSLDDRRTSSKCLKKIRSDFAAMQNSRLESMGYELDDSNRVQYRSYKERGINKPNTNISRYHWNELQQLKKRYSYIDDVQERNEKIIEDRDGKLTKKRIEYLRNEYMNESKNSRKDTVDLTNRKMEQADANRKSGYRNHRLAREASHKLSSVVNYMDRENSEMESESRKGMSR